MIFSYTSTCHNHVVEKGLSLSNDICSIKDVKEKYDFCLLHLIQNFYFLTKVFTTRSNNIGKKFSPNFPFKKT